MRRAAFKCGPGLGARCGGGTCAQRRDMRTRSNPPTTTLALHEVTAPEMTSSMQRPSPSAMQLSFLLDQFPGNEDGALSDSQTEAAVWSAPTLQDAWRTYYHTHSQCAEQDPMRAAELRTKDLPALARVTALAETRHLLALLPPHTRAAVTSHAGFSCDAVEEFFMHLGQDIEVRCGAGALVRLDPPSLDDLQHVLQRVGSFGDDGRGCVAHTGHRVSLWRGRRGEPLGVTIRVGRYLPGAATALVPLTARGSLLIISKAGMGKTTLLRDLAASLANQPHEPRVTIVDTSNEIGGDGPVPLPFLGRCRRIQVPSRDAQGRIMTEVIQNHTPEYLIVDELATAEEAQAAWSISQRGVRLIATCHGEHLAGLIQNQSLNLLVGGAAQAFLSNEERRLKNKTKKTILERPYASPFASVVELRDRERGFVYVDVNKAADLILDDKNATREASVGGEVVLGETLPARLQKLAARVDQAVMSHTSTDDKEQRAVPPLTHDADGYSVPAKKQGWHGDNGSSKPRKPKTNNQLYDELSDFL